MSERESKWWCGGCGGERDISVSSCPSCESTVLTSKPLQPSTDTNAAPVATASSSFPRIIRGAV